MEQGHYLSFGDFHLDPIHKRLWRGEQAIALRSRPLAVLHYFLTHPARVISKEELLKQVWAGTYVTKTALQVCVRAIREALDEDVNAPQYLETVGREGYRWIGAVQSPKSKVRGPESAIFNPQSAIVGREAELERLRGWLGTARRGIRQVVFLAGEAGIGKTTVVDVFVERLRAEGAVRIGRGQCLEQYGEGEAYLPVLEALAQVCRAPGGQQAIDILSRYAPTWLVQMPALIEESALAALQQRVAGATRERMLREMADALAALTEVGAQYATPLVLVCEDLHASDRSTIDLLVYLAQRREQARLLILGTYRPATVVVKEHPLSGIVRELRVHEQCQELRLELLTEADVTAYLAVRLALPSPLAGEILGQDGEASRLQHGQTPPLPSPLPRGEREATSPLRKSARQVHRHTEGNPLFLVNMVAYLLQQGLLRAVDGQWQIEGSLKGIGIPENLQQMIAQQVARLSSEEQQVLAAASVQGYEFDAAVVAKVLAREAAEVEERLAELEHIYGFVRFMAEEEFPDRTLRLRYRFVHVLYQNALYASLTPTRKAQWSGAVAQALVGYYGEKSDTIAGELAQLYRTVREYGLAAQYYLVAARNAAQVFAHAEAIALARQGLDLLNLLPDTPKRVQHELRLQMTLGSALLATKGYGAAEVEQTYTRARDLCRQMGETPQLFRVLGALQANYLIRGELQIARELAEQLLRLAQDMPDPALSLRAQLALGPTLFFVGEFPSAREHLEQGIALYDSRKYRSPVLQDPGVVCLSVLALDLWCLGYPDQAVRRSREALNLAQEMSHPFGLVHASTLAALLHQFRREGQAAHEHAEAAITLSHKQDFPHFTALATMLRGWALTEQGQEEGVAQIRQGLVSLRATGAEAYRMCFLTLLAEACGTVGQVEEGLSVLTEALEVGRRTGERFYEVEVYRLRGTLTLQKFQVPGSKFQVQENQKSKAKGQKPVLSVVEGAKIPNPRPLTPDPQAEAEAEACFQQAIGIARQQEAKSLELRAAVSLSRLWQRQGKKEEARKLLASVYGWFTEGSDAADLQEAKALLEELSQ